MPQPSPDWGDQAFGAPGSGGRPRTRHFDREEAARLRAEGLFSWGEIAKRVGAGRDAVQRAVRLAVSTPAKSGFDTPLIPGLTHPEPTRAKAPGLPRRPGTLPGKVRAARTLYLRP